MKRVSERSGHDTASAKVLQVPTFSDMKIDLDTIDEFRGELSKRRSVNEKRRIAFEKPPKAETM